MSGPGAAERRRRIARLERLSVLAVLLSGPVRENSAPAVGPSAPAGAGFRFGYGDPNRREISSKPVEASPLTCPGDELPGGQGSRCGSWCGSPRTPRGAGTGSAAPSPGGRPCREISSEYTLARTAHVSDSKSGHAATSEREQAECWPRRPVRTRLGDGLRRGHASPCQVTRIKVPRHLHRPRPSQSAQRARRTRQEAPVLGPRARCRLAVGGVAE